MRYPLENLLSLRKMREEAAQSAVRAAEAALRRAQDAVKRLSEELKAYKIWRVQETDRRYDAIMETTLSQSQLDHFKKELAALERTELLKEEELSTAKEEQKKKAEDLKKAQISFKEATKSREKIDLHKELWREEEKKEQQRLEDLEMEEFKTKAKNF